MILSMTGFGRASESSSSKKITVDIKSLNSKQLDLMTRVPSCFKEVELQARNLISSELERGKVEMNVVFESLADETPSKLNIAVLAAYKCQIEKMASDLNLPMPGDWYSTLLRMPDALKQDIAELKEDEKQAFLNAVAKAIAALVDFRINEGKKLYDFFVQKINNISDLLLQVEPFEKERVPKIKTRMEEQLEKLTSIDYDRGRLEQEMIFYLEKLDVTEEKIRLRAHLNYFLDTLGAPEEKAPTRGKGKKLGFIAQEMGREINTLGSKSNQAEMQMIVVKMKDELEQIKEQVLNVL